MPTVQQWAAENRSSGHHVRSLYAQYAQRSPFLARSDRILGLCSIPVRPFTARTLLPAVLCPQRVAQSHASCHQHLSATLCFRRQVAHETRARCRCGAGSDTATCGHDIAARTFRARQTSGVALAVPLTAARLPEPDLSCVARFYSVYLTRTLPALERCETKG